MGGRLTLDVHRKIFLASLSPALRGAPLGAKVVGTPEQVSAITEVVVASRDLLNVSEREDATVSSVVEAIERRNLAADRFFDVVGFRWPM